MGSMNAFDTSPPWFQKEAAVSVLLSLLLWAPPSFQVLRPASIKWEKAGLNR